MLGNFDSRRRASSFDRQALCRLVCLNANFSFGIGRRRLLRVARADHVGLQIGFRRERYDLFALTRNYTGILSVKRALVLTAAKIRDSDAGEHAPVDLFWR